MYYYLFSRAGSGIIKDFEHYISATKDPTSSDNNLSVEEKMIDKNDIIV